jgi:hypothetical protein
MLAVLLWIYLAVGAVVSVYLLYVSWPLRRSDLFPMCLVALVAIVAWPFVLIILTKLLVDMWRRPT